MNVWFAIPSCRPVEEAQSCIDRWIDLGYRIALLRQGPLLKGIDIQIPTGRYMGWAASVNFLCPYIRAQDADAEWIVTGGDDYKPHPTILADRIGRQCSTHFHGTFGVMQPTGDRWGDSAQSRAQFGEGRGAIIDRIAGSPWMGREWCRRAYQGSGPLCKAYHHNYADEELQNVAIKLGVFWQRPDLLQKHDHWMAIGQPVPPHAKYINFAEYDESRPLFQQRQQMGFPGHEPIA